MHWHGKNKVFPKGWLYLGAAAPKSDSQDKEKKCGINLGKSSFSYYTTKDGKVEGMNNIKFTPTALIKTLEGLSA